MIRINLLPVKELKAEVDRRREIMLATVALVVAVVSILGVYLYHLHRASILEKELTQLRSELQIFNGKAKEVSLIQTKMKEYQSKLQVLESINKKKAGPAGVMDSLSAATPGTLWLTEFRETAGNVTITGVATDNQTIAEFMKALSSYPFFKETELVETTQSDQPGLPPRKFSIKAKLFYQPQAEPPSKEKGGVQPVATKSGK
ncbi:MAG TPA: PilN domain-containing protein [Methylomirabilota bacterium]|nr:PilN domain-containing protein [Methylomirabilota bacterium]